MSLGHAALAIVVAIPIAGCLESLPGFGGGSCRDMPGDVVFRFLIEPGLVPPQWVGDRYWLLSDGSLVYVHGTRERGGGVVSANESGLRNITAGEAAAVLQSFHDYSPEWDYQIDRAFRTSIPSADFQSFCKQALSKFPTLAPYYNHPGCADAGTINMTASLLSGTHSAASYCGAGPQAYRDIQETFFRLAEAAKARVGFDA